MTLTTTITHSGPYTGTGATDTYAYNFRILQDSDIVVIETTDAGVVSTLTLTTDYTVTGAGDAGGGNVVRVAGNLPTDYTWLIYRNTSTTQATDFTSQGSFAPQVHEDAIDKVAMVAQEFDDAASRMMSIPRDDGALNLELPLVADRSEKVLAFDSSGEPDLSLDVSQFIGTDSGTFNPTWTGFSAPPGQNDVYWTRVGNVVWVRFLVYAGTSNATTMTITDWPSAIRPTFRQTVHIPQAVDNGSQTTTPTMMTIDNSAIVLFGLGYDNAGSSNGWTASGSKGLSRAADTMSLVVSYLLS